MHISYWFIGVGCWRKLGRPAPWVRLILIIVLCDLDSFAFAVVEMGAEKSLLLKAFSWGSLFFFFCQDFKGEVMSKTKITSVGLAM